MQTGQTPLSIAQRLGYISVVEVLKNITEVTDTPATDEKYKVVTPETMQETLMTDSEDEGGEWWQEHRVAKEWQWRSTVSDLILTFRLYL